MSFSRITSWEICGNNSIEIAGGLKNIKILTLKFCFDKLHVTALVNRPEDRRLFTRAVTTPSIILRIRVSGIEREAELTGKKFQKMEYLQKPLIILT